MRIRRNISLIKLNWFFASLWPLSPLAIVYFEQITNSYVLALGVFSIANIAQTLCEVPTGIYSDKIGRKYTVCLSSFLFLLSYLSFAYAGNTNSILLLNIGGFLWGVAEAFASGTDDALLYETMDDLRKKEKYDIVYSSAMSFSQLGLAVAAVFAAIATYFWSLHTVAWIALIPATIQLIISFLLIEPKSRKNKDDNKSPIKHFLTSTKNILSNRKLLKLSLLNAFNHATSMCSHRLEGVYFSMLIPMWLVNVTRIIKQFCGAISFYFAKHFRKYNLFKIMFVSSLGNIITKIAGLLVNGFATPFIMSFVNIFYGTEATAQSTLLQKEFSSKQRATMGSVVSLFASIVLAIMYYFIGFVADKVSVYIAMLTLILFKLIISLNYFSMLQKYK